MALGAIIVGSILVVGFILWRLRRPVFEPLVPEADAELSSWLRCLEAEYRAGDLGIEDLKTEVARYVRLWEESHYPLWPAERAEKVERIVKHIR